MRTATEHVLPSGRAIRTCSAPVLLSTKLEAYSDRGAADPLISHDLEDIIRLVDGRPGLVDEIAGADEQMRDSIRAGVAGLLGRRISRDSIPMLMLPDSVSQSRAATVVVPRMEQIASAR